jgi:DNA replication protein DnaC
MNGATSVEAIDALLTEELTTRENRRVRMAVQMARLSAIKTLAGFDFAFQPSLDRNRILALAGLQFIRASNRRRPCSRLFRHLHC